MCDYADWWNKRNSINWDVKIENNHLVVDSTCDDTSIWLSAKFPSGETLLNPIAKKSSFKKWECKLPKMQNVIRQDPKYLRKYNWRITVNDLESYYGKLKQ